MATAISLSGQCFAQEVSSDTAAIERPPGEESQVNDIGNDIVVTATRQSERASRVPISISAFGQAKLDQQGIKTFEDLQRQLPGVTFNPDTRTIAVRGIDSDAGAPTTGVYIDDTPFQLLNIGILTQNTLPTVFDLDRVEVLRGPQGTLFGAGAQGGVVRYITPQPSLTDTKIYARSELGQITHGGYDAEAGAALSIPLAQDKIALRVSAFYRHAGGWIDQLDWRTYETDQKDVNFRNTVALRAGMKLQFGDLTIYPSLQYQDTKERPDSFNIAASDLKDGDFRATAVESVKNRDRWYLPTFKVEYALGEALVTSNTSWFRRRQKTGYDGTTYLARQYASSGLETITDFGPFATPTGIRLPIGDYLAPARVRNSQNNFVQEVRIQSTAASPLTWVIGAFYSNNRGSNYETIADPEGDRLTQALYGLAYEDFWGSPLEGELNYYGLYNVKDTQLAVFGEATYEFVERLKLTLGARYAKTKFSYTNNQGGPLNGVPTGGEGKQTEKPFTPRISLAFQADANNMFYGTVSKGFRIGGANAPIPVAPCASDLAALGLDRAPTNYDGDTTWNYELGSKNKFGKLSLSASAYYVKWSGIQQATSLPTCGFRYIDNLGAARSKGFDLQAQASLFDGFDISIAGAYTDARLTRSIVAPNGGGLIVNKGQSLEAPEWTLAVGGQYNFVVDENKTFIRFDYQHIDRFLGLTAQLDPATTSFDPGLTKPGPRNYVTMRTGVELGSMSLSVFVDNLLNSSKVLSRFHDALESPIYSGTSSRPRAFVLQAVFRN